MSIAQTLSTPNPPPIPDSYWVVPGRLLAGEYPGAKTDAEARRKLRLFLDAGVTVFLDLTEAGELAPYALLLREEAAIKQIVETVGTPDAGRVSPETHAQRERVRNWPVEG